MLGREAELPVVPRSAPLTLPAAVAAPGGIQRPNRRRRAPEYFKDYVLGDGVVRGRLNPQAGAVWRTLAWTPLQCGCRGSWELVGCLLYKGPSGSYEFVRTSVVNGFGWFIVGV